MSMAEWMRAVASLPAAQQNESAAFLLHLRLQHDPAWRTDMAQRIDDKDPAYWTTLEDWKQEFAAGGDKG